MITVFGELAQKQRIVLIPLKEEIYTLDLL